MTRRKFHNPIRNVRVEDGGKAYRVCFHHERPIMVMLKCPRGGERPVEITGRRGRAIIAKANAS